MNLIKIISYSQTEAEMNQIRNICQDFSYFNFYLEFFQDSYYKVFLAQLSQLNQIVGVIVVSRHSFNLYGDFLWIHKDFRKQGVGSVMIKFILDRAEKAGYRSLIGETPETDIDAQKLYTKAGGDFIGKAKPIYNDPFQIFTYRFTFKENLAHPKPIKSIEV
jgi:ribosomal protein S18 acetylase RimI-like enzyme